jgi:PKD repeat protein
MIFRHTAIANVALAAVHRAPARAGRRGVFAAVLALGLAACGGGGGGGTSPGPLPAGAAPVANFAFSCADLACSFTSTSTTQVVGDVVAAHRWSFGDSTAVVTTPVVNHVFAAAGDYDVTLTVADAIGTTTSIVKRVTISAAPSPAAPHSQFTASCVSLDCTFVDTSTYDAGSSFSTRLWEFGDSVTLAASSPATHHYSASSLTSYNVKLSVTDSAGKTSTSVQSVTVAPPATTLNCVGGNCVLSLAQASTVTATLVSHSCSAQQNQVLITAPIPQLLFADGCSDSVGLVVPVNGGSTFAANTTLEVAVLSGIVPTASLAFTPAIRVSGDFASGWTLTFDDGYGGPGEPDFNDLVILIKATP